MKRLTFKSPLSLMILFIATNNQPLFSNDITVAPKLSLKIRNTIYEYIKNVYYISTYIIASYLYLISALGAIGWFRNQMNHITSIDRLYSIYMRAIIPTLLIVPFIKLIPAVNLLYQSYSCSLTIAPPLVIFIAVVCF